MESFRRSLHDKSFSSLNKASLWFGNNDQAVNEPIRERAATFSGRINIQSSFGASVNNDRSKHNAPARMGILEQLLLIKDQVVSKTKAAMTWNKISGEEADIHTLLTDEKQSSDIDIEEILANRSSSNATVDFSLNKISDVIERNSDPEFDELDVIHDSKNGTQKSKGNFSSRFTGRRFSRVKHASHVNIKPSTKDSLKVGQLRMSLQCFQKSRQMKVILHRIHDVNLRKSTVFMKASVAFDGIKESTKSKFAQATNEGSEIIFKDCVYIDIPRGKTETNDYLLKLKLYKVCRLFRCARKIGVAVIPFGHDDFFLDTTISVNLQHPNIDKMTSDITVIDDSFQRTIEFEAANSCEKIHHQRNGMKRRRRFVTASPYKVAR